MSDDHTKEIEAAKEEILVAVARLEKLMGESVIVTNRSIEGMRSQNSSEHGSLFAKLEYLSIAVTWIKSRWEKFTRNPHD